MTTDEYAARGLTPGVGDVIDGERDQWDARRQVTARVPFRGEVVRVMQNGWPVVRLADGRELAVNPPDEPKKIAAPASTPTGRPPVPQVRS